MLRRTLITLLVVATTIVVAGLSLPWWFGAALRWQGGSAGLTFSEYQTVGYARWALLGVRVERPEISLTIDRLEAPHPIRLWFQRAPADPISLGEVTVTYHPPTEPAAAAPTDLGPRQVHELVRVYGPLLPSVGVDSIRLLGVTPDPIRLRAVRWSFPRVEMGEVRYRQLAARVVAEAGSGAAPAPAELPALAALQVAALDASWRSEFILRTGAAAGYEIAATGRWAEQDAAGSIHLSDTRWLPTHLTLNQSDGVFAGADLGLAAYQQIFADTMLRWSGDSYEFLANWRGIPGESGQAPPLAVDIALRGDLARSTLTRLQLDLPGLNLSLDEPLQISNQDWAAETASRFLLSADLSQVPWVSGAGKVQGSAKVTTRGMAWPEVEVSLTADGVTWASMPPALAKEPLSAEVRGGLRWPEWTVRDAQIAQAGGLAVSFSGRGTADEIEESQWAVNVAGAALAEWLEPSMSVDRLTATGSLSGQQGAWSHEGALTLAALKYPGFRPLGLTGQWSGEQLEVALEAQVRSGAGQLDLTGEVTATAAEVRAKLLGQDQLIFETRSPVKVDWSDELRVQGLDLVGPAGTVEVNRWSALGGEVGFALADPARAWLADWLEVVPTIPTIRTLAGEVAWDETALTGEVGFDGDVREIDGDGLALRFTASSNGQALTVTEGELAWRQLTVARVAGTLPVRLSVQSPFWEIVPEGAVNARIALAKNPPVWEALNESTRFRLENPRLEVDLAGTWQRPRGQGYLAVDRITFAEDAADGPAWPVVTEVEAKLVDEGEGLVVDPVTARVDGQRISLRGELPFTPAEWTELSEDPLAYFRDQGRGEIEIPRAPLSAFARFLPDFLVPTGELEVALSYAPGTGTNGRIQLQDVVSKPLGPLGILQNIVADLRFDNRTMSIRTATALMGGQPLAVTGGAAWPRGEEVELDLALRGENLPVIRKAGVLLRSDLDLTIQSDASGQGLVSGNARLRDGLVLVDVRSLVPRGGGAVAVPARRPPYFSVSVAPLNGWDLDVALEGEDFLRLRTPIVTGTGSLRARLDGTLENPRLLGEMELSDAFLRLPFARLEIDEALVQLTEADPYDPELFVRATGQRLGYDLQLELTGKASEPILSLQSSPTLTAEEVLMLVMAGVTPNGGTDLVNSNRAMRLGMYFGRGILGDLLGTDERERLSVSTGEKLSRLGRETYRFEYEIEDRWSVVGEYDEFDYYNAALKWRIRPGIPPAAEPAEPAESEEEDHHE